MNENFRVPPWGFSIRQNLNIYKDATKMAAVFSICAAFNW